MIQQMAFAEGRGQAAGFCHPDPPPPPEKVVFPARVEIWLEGEPQGIPAGEQELLGTLDPWEEEEEVEPSDRSLHCSQNTQPLEKAAEKH